MAKQKLAAVAPATETAPKIFNMTKVKILTTGITPILCHNPAGMEIETSDTTRRRKANPTVKEMAERSVYLDEEGNFGFPNAALVTAIIEGAEAMKLKVGSGRYAPAAANILRSGLSFDYEVEYAKLVDPKTMKPLTKYEVDKRRGVNPSTGGGIVCVRPKFFPWAAIFHVLIDTGNEQLMAVMDSSFPDILRYAGTSIGLGAFRAYVKPRGRMKQSCGGPFGKFSAIIVN